MPALVDRSGVRYGRLVAIERVGTSHLGKAVWGCRCDCGNYTKVDACSLATGSRHPRPRATVRLARLRFKEISA